MMKPYHKPRGWIRFAVGEASAGRKEKLRNWHVAYHGTDLKAAMPALDGIDEGNMEAIAATAAEADEQNNAALMDGLQPSKRGSGTPDGSLC